MILAAIKRSKWPESVEVGYHTQSCICSYCMNLYWQPLKLKVFNKRFLITQFIWDILSIAGKTVVVLDFTEHVIGNVNYGSLIVLSNST